MSGVKCQPRREPRGVRGGAGRAVPRGAGGDRAGGEDGLGPRAAAGDLRGADRRAARRGGGDAEGDRRGHPLPVIVAAYPIVITDRLRECRDFYARWFALEVVRGELDWTRTGCGST